MEPYKLSDKMTGYDLVKLREVLNEVDEEIDDVKNEDIKQTSNPLFEHSSKDGDSDEEWGEIISNMSNNVCSVNDIIKKKKLNSEEPDGIDECMKKERISSEDSNSSLPLTWDNNWVLLCDNLSSEMSKAHSLLSLFGLKENVDYKFIVNDRTLTVQRLKFDQDDNSMESSNLTYKFVNHSKLDEPEESSIRSKIHKKLDEGIKFKKLNGRGYLKVSWFTDGVYQTILNDINWDNTKSEDEAIIKILKLSKLYKMMKKTCEI